MIIANLSDCHRYEQLHPLFKEFFDYIAAHDMTAAEAGRITLLGEDLYINVAEPMLEPREQRPMEVHRSYIDIQVPLLQSETFGWSALNTLGKSDEPFDTANDFALYSRPASNYFTVEPGQFVVFFPEDAHAPLIGEGKQKKLIGKVSI